MPTWLEPWMPLLTAMPPLVFVEWMRRRHAAEIARLKASANGKVLNLEEARMLQDSRRDDWERMRSELERLTKRVDELEERERECEEDREALRRQLATANLRITHLEERVRRGTSGLAQDYYDEAAG